MLTDALWCPKYLQVFHDVSVEHKDNFWKLLQTSSDYHPELEMLDFKESGQLQKQGMLSHF